VRDRGIVHQYTRNLSDLQPAMVDKCATPSVDTEKLYQTLEVYYGPTVLSLKDRDRINHDAGPKDPVLFHALSLILVQAVSRRRLFTPSCIYA
jgi:hypothetical protein